MLSPGDPNAKHIVQIPDPSAFWTSAVVPNPNTNIPVRPVRPKRPAGPQVNVPALLSAVEGIQGLAERARVGLEISDPAWDVLNRIESLAKDARAGGGSDYWWDKLWLADGRSRFTCFVNPYQDDVGAIVKRTPSDANWCGSHFATRGYNRLMRGITVLPGGDFILPQIAWLRENAALTIFVRNQCVVQYQMSQLLEPSDASFAAQEIAAALAQENPQVALRAALQAREKRFDKPIMVQELEAFQVDIDVGRCYRYNPLPPATAPPGTLPTLQVFLRGYEWRSTS